MNHLFNFVGGAILGHVCFKAYVDNTALAIVSLLAVIVFLNIGFHLTMKKVFKELISNGASDDQKDVE